MDRLRDALNEQTPDATHCAWPGCRTALQYELKGQWLDHRFGILCFGHAADIAAAVVQSQVAVHRFQQNVAALDSARMARAHVAAELEAQHQAETARRQQGHEGFVYYLKVGERIKVGFSTDVKKRMRQYPPGSELLAVEPGDYDLEKQRHQQFAGSRTDGREWFRPTADLMSHIGDLVLVHGEAKRFAHHFRKNQQPMRQVRYT